MQGDYGLPRGEQFVDQKFIRLPLNDPWVVCLPDGRHRMYVTALVGDPAQGTKPVIASASTSKAN